MNINDLGFPFTSDGGDRRYGSADFREYFDKLLDGGIVGDVGNELSVEPQAVPNKSIYVDTGVIFIKGAMRILETTTTLSLADNTSGNPRIDRVVARLNYMDKKIEFAVLEGTPGSSPSVPNLTQNAICWEFSLAQIAVSNGYSTITVNEITDERDDETFCGYFRYRAKPAWYPGGEVPMDAWKYILFKNELTAQEISDIETNSTLMAIIDGNTFKAFKEKSFWNFAAKFYAGSDVTISIDATLTDGFNFYDNLTIDAGITLTCRSGVTFIIVNETLTLNGTINADGKGASGGSGATYFPEGGDGGGVLVIYANEVTGSGNIIANGVDGLPSIGNSSGSDYGNGGGAGSFLGQPVNYTGASKVALTLFRMGEGDIGAEGGGSGAYDGDSSYRLYYGDGGDGIYGAGGKGSYVDDISDGASGSGGGGGGAVILVSNGDIPAISISANGGDGGSGADGYNSNHKGLGGGAGGGGLISIAATASSAATSAVAGVPGAGGTVEGHIGPSGSAGLVEIFELDID
jgi:hypothetical protein